MLTDSVRILLVACLASVGWMTATVLMGAYVIGPLLSRYHAGEVPDELEGQLSVIPGLARIIPFPMERSRLRAAPARCAERSRDASVVPLRQSSHV